MSYKIYLNGEDNSKFDDENHDFFKEPDSENNDNQKQYERYFPRFERWNPNDSVPLNLGIYYQKKFNKNDEIDTQLRTAQYSGIIPLLEKDSLKETGLFLAVSPRFKASPSAMLSYILKSSDFLYNSSQLNYRSYRKNDIIRYNQDNKSSEKILFCTISDMNEIPINKKDLENNENSYENIVHTVSLFEIMNYLDKLYIICQKVLKHQSEQVKENLYGKVKGRIDVAKQIKFNIAQGRPDRVYCSYNKLTVNNKENQILKYGLYLCEKELAQYSGLGHYEDKLLYCKRALAGVALKKCCISDFNSIKNNGAFKYYKPAMEAAKKIYKRISVDFTGDRDSNEKIKLTHKVKPFFMDMNLLFEIYSRCIVADILSEITLEEINENKKIIIESCKLIQYGDERKIFNLEDSDNNETDTVTGFIKVMYPDILIKDSSGKAYAVIDAKYSTMSSSGNREKTHQILAYMFRTDCQKGGFISPITNDEEVEKYCRYTEEKKQGIIDGLSRPILKENDVTDDNRIGFRIPLYLPRSLNDINSDEFNNNKMLIKEFIKSKLIVEKEISEDGQ